MSTTLDGTGELDLDEPMSLELVVLQPSDVAMSSQQHIQGGCRFLSVHAGERGDSRALMDGAGEGQKGRRYFLPISHMLVAEYPQHDIKVMVNWFQGVGLRVVSGSEGQPDTGMSESLLHHMGVKVRGVVGMYLQGITKPGLQHLQSAQYLIAGGAA